MGMVPRDYRTPVICSDGGVHKVAIRRRGSAAPSSGRRSVDGKAGPSLLELVDRRHQQILQDARSHLALQAELCQLVEEELLLRPGGAVQSGISLSGAHLLMEEERR